MSLKAYRCPNCGGMINLDTMRCPHCDTQYREEYDGTITKVKVEVCEAKIHELGVCNRIDDIFLEKLPEKEREDFSMHVIDQMAYSLAKQLVPFMKIQTHKDPTSMATIVQGKLKVVEPHHDY